MTFSPGWSLQPGLKGIPARSARPRPRREPLISDYGQPRLERGGFISNFLTRTKGPYQPRLKAVFLLVIVRIALQHIVK
jgi:hypothetical protein